MPSPIATASRGGKKLSYRPRIAITYNDRVGGECVFSMIRALEAIGAEVVLIDYREIVSIIEVLLEFSYTRCYSEIAVVMQKAKLRAAVALADVDGLVIPGAATDVCAALYGKHDDGTRTDIHRSFEAALIHVALLRGMPIMGVCGGHQLLNVFLGGTLRDMTKEEKRELMYGGGSDFSSVVTFDPMSTIGKTVSKGEWNTEGNWPAYSLYSNHCQVIDNLGGVGLIAGGNNYLSVSARVDFSSQYIEAVESRYGGAPAVGVQWHPEVELFGMPASIFMGTVNRAEGPYALSCSKKLRILRLFKSFNEASKTYKTKRVFHAQLSMMEQNTEHLRGGVSIAAANVNSKFAGIVAYNEDQLLNGQESDIIKRHENNLCRQKINFQIRSLSAYSSYEYNIDTNEISDILGRRKPAISIKMRIDDANRTLGNAFGGLVIIGMYARNGLENVSYDKSLIRGNRWCN